MDEKIRKLLDDELGALFYAMQRFERQTDPRTAAPRKPEFPIFVDGDRRAVIPANEGSRYGAFAILRANGRTQSTDKRGLLGFIAGGNPPPRKLYQTLCNIRRAREWHEARTEGRKRAAAEILRQQAKWIQKLDDEGALNSLKR